MWCRNCNIETNEEICPVCGAKTEEDIPAEIYWCDHCEIPIIKETRAVDKEICPLCGAKTKYMTTDIRPVFPEERLLFELMTKKKPGTYKKMSMWAAKNRIYVNGKGIAITSKEYREADIGELVEGLKENKNVNDDAYEYFDVFIDRFCRANKVRLDYLIDEASHFVRETAEDFPPEQWVISFSGGKDSTVTADVVVKALSDPSIVHIFGNTTLEFPTTIEYAERFRKNHPHAIFEIAKNYEQVFMDVCEDIGPQRE